MRPRPKSWATGKTIRMSPSSRKTFLLCEGKWWFAKVLGRYEEPKHHLMLGSAVHHFAEERGRGHGRPTHSQAVEALNATRRNPELDPPYTVDLVHEAEQVFDRVAALGILPAKLTGEGVDAMVEARVQGWCGPLPYLGFVDYARRIPNTTCLLCGAPAVDGVCTEGSECHQNGGASHPLLRITDYKTTSAYFWGEKTPEQLAHDIQMLFYAGALMGNPTPNGGIDLDEARAYALEVEHIYFLTGKPKKNDPPGKRVCTPASWDTVAETWQGYIGTGHDMLWAADRRKVTDLTLNTNACGKYKGCPFAAECPASPVNRNRGSEGAAPTAPVATTQDPPANQATHTEADQAAKETPMMSISERLAAAKAAQQGAPPPHPAPQPAAAPPQAAKPSPVTPPDAAPTATPTEAQWAAVTAKAKEITAAGGLDGFDEPSRDQYLTGLLKRHSLPAGPMDVRRLHKALGLLDGDSGQPLVQPLATTPDEVQTPDVAGDLPDAATQPGRGGLGPEFDGELGAKAVHKRLVAEGLTEFDAEVVKKYARDAFSNEDVPRMSAKMYLDVLHKGYKLELWHDAGAHLALGPVPTKREAVDPVNGAPSSSSAGEAEVVDSTLEEVHAETEADREVVVRDPDEVVHVVRRKPHTLNYKVTIDDTDLRDVKTFLINPAALSGTVCTDLAAHLPEGAVVLEVTSAPPMLVVKARVQVADGGAA